MQHPLHLLILNTGVETRIIHTETSINSSKDHYPRFRD